jgi:hypothetical protein
MYVSNFEFSNSQNSNSNFEFLDFKIYKYFIATSYNFDLRLKKEISDSIAPKDMDENKDLLFEALGLQNFCGLSENDLNPLKERLIDALRGILGKSLAYTEHGRRKVTICYDIQYGIHFFFVTSKLKREYHLSDGSDDIDSISGDIPGESNINSQEISIDSKTSINSTTRRFRGGLIKIIYDDDYSRDATVYPYNARNDINSNDVDDINDEDYIQNEDSDIDDDVSEEENCRGKKNEFESQSESESESDSDSDLEMDLDEDYDNSRNLLRNFLPSSCESYANLLTPRYCEHASKTFLQDIDDYQRYSKNAIDLAHYGEFGAFISIVLEERRNYRTDLKGTYESYVLSKDLLVSYAKLIIKELKWSRRKNFILYINPFLSPTLHSSNIIGNNANTSSRSITSLVSFPNVLPVVSVAFSQLDLVKLITAFI